MEVIFSGTVSQNRAKDFLIQSIGSHTFHQALLIHGNSGLGQTSLLLDIAGILICGSQEKLPCGKCKRCLELKHQNCDNLHFILPLLEINQKKPDLRIEAVSEKWPELRKDPYRYRPKPKEYISIYQIRDLKERLAFSEISGRKRVVLIFWSETMPPAAANALLKILEEPPANTFFILGTENKFNILPTIISRCILLGLSPLTLNEMRAFIEQYHDSEIKNDQSLLPLCGGSPGMFLQLGDVEGSSLLHISISLLKNLIHLEWPEFSQFIEAKSEFEKMESCLIILKLSLEIIRLAVSPSTEGGAEDHTGYLSQDLGDIIKELSGLPDIRPYINYLEKTTAAVSGYAHARAAFIGNFMGMQTVTT